MLFAFPCIFDPTFLSLLSLHSSSAISAHELGHIGDRNSIEISDNAVLETAGCNCKFQSFLARIIIIQTIDQAG